MGLVHWSSYHREGFRLARIRMAEIIPIWELQEARRRASRRDGERQNLERALAIIRWNLARAADRLREAPLAMQAEFSAASSISQRSQDTASGWYATPAIPNAPAPVTSLGSRTTSLIPVLKANTKYGSVYCALPGSSVGRADGC
jgi:hypothetical protein